MITTFGPGAIVDLRAQVTGGGPVSVVVSGIDEWDISADSQGKGIENEQVISEPRLEEILSRSGTPVNGFRLPPVVIKKNNVYVTGDRLVGVRFPSWLQCPRCHLLQHHDSWARPADLPLPNPFPKPYQNISLNQT